MLGHTIPIRAGKKVEESLQEERKWAIYSTTDLCVNCSTSEGAVARQKYLAKPGSWDTRAGISRLIYSSLVMRLERSVSPCCVGSHTSSMLIAMPDSKWEIS